MAASGYLLPTVQTHLQTRFATDEAVHRIQSLILNTGSALIGAAAIVTLLVLFAMQVNVERMPHGLFRRLSEDRKLLGAFASTFVLANAVAAISTLAEQTNLAIALVAAVRWSCSYAMNSVRAHGPTPKARSTILASPTTPPWMANIPAWPLRSARITSKPLSVA